MSGQGYALVVAVLIIVATGLVLLVPLRREARRMLQHPDLLVPLGLLVLATGMVEWTLTWPVLGTILAPAWQLSLVSLSFSLSVGLVIQVALAVAFAAWSLSLICVTTEDRAPDLLEGLRSIRRGFWRTFGYMAIAITGFYLLLAVMIAMASFALPLAVIGIGVGTLLLNFATAGALLRGIARPEVPFWQCFRESVAASSQHLSRWWAPLLLQMEILGLLTFVHLSFSSYGNHRSVSNWAVNGMWTGGFESDSRWLSNVMDAVEAPAPAVVATLLGLVLGILAVAVKLRIARELHQLGELTARMEKTPIQSFNNSR